MNKLNDLIKSHQQQLVLVLGYLLVVGLAFGLGRLTAFKYAVPDIKIEQPTAEIPPIPTNYTPAVAGLQSDCKIKGTASSKIYHTPGQSGYDKLTATTCFDTEAAAQAAGFRKALR